jgi:hypothetical protein
MSVNTKVLLAKSRAFFSSRRESGPSLLLLLPQRGRHIVPQSSICGMINGRWGRLQMLGGKPAAPPLRPL